MNQLSIPGGRPLSAPRASLMKQRAWPVDRGIRTAVVTLLAPISWGTTYVTVTELLPPDRPLFVAAMRVAPAGALLTGIGLVRAGWWPSGRQWRDLAMLAVLNFGLFFPLLILAVYRLPGGVAASIGGVQPLLVGTITWLWVGTVMRRSDVAVGVIAAVGVALVVVRPGAAIDPVGVGAALAANVSFSTGVVATRALPAPSDRLAATGWQLVMASLFLTPVAWMVEGPQPDLSAISLAGFAYLGLAATGGAFVVWFRGIERLPVQAPPLLGLAAPITGAALGWIVLNEELTVFQLAGFVITIAAIGYGATSPARTAPRVDPLAPPTGRQAIDEQLQSCEGV